MNNKTIAVVGNAVLAMSCAAMVGLQIYARRVQKQIEANQAELDAMMAPKQTCCKAPYYHATSDLCWK